jgi:hypothetical protein
MEKFLCFPVTCVLLLPYKAIGYSVHILVDTVVGSGHLQIRLENKADLGAIGRLLNAALSALHHVDRLANTRIILSSTRFGAGWLRRPRNYRIVCERCSSSLVTVFHLEARTMSVVCLTGCNVQPYKISAFLQAVPSVILSDDRIRCAAAEGDVGN